MKANSYLTYISLFSGAGVGCHGFKLENFECVATNELVARRLAVQKYNHKCKYESGYILGDVSVPTIKEKLFNEISMWKSKENLKEIDVVVATPPCQGMSVANHKKTSNEIIRNSLIIESIKIISDIKPKIFIFENVPLFMKTLCTDTDGIERPIGEAIERNLGVKYSVYSQVLNFKDYGACSSRTRTLVIAVRRDLTDFFSPIELFPSFKPEVTLFDAIGDMKSLSTFGEIDESDIYHSFRPYPQHMRKWISALTEGQSAFENKDKNRIPHQIINGKVVYNQQKNGDKYRRQIWNKIGPCVHTRNDQLASQNTVHPTDDRVFSIRELMIMMTLPFDFKWTDTPFAKLNNLSDNDKRKFLKKEEIKIRQSLGEAVPTEIFQGIATNIKKALNKHYLTDAEVKSEIAFLNLTNVKQLIKYVKQNPLNLGFSSLCRIVELANSKRNEQEAYFTNKSLINEIIKFIPEIIGENLSILEPSVGAGNFLPFIIKLFEKKKNVNITVVDIDNNALLILKELVKHIDKPANITIEYICEDFLSNSFNGKFNFVVGNPPFSKSTQKEKLKQYRANSINNTATNTSAFFLEKALSVGDYVALVMPKFLLNTPEFAATRNYLSKHSVDAIVDFGERGFGGVLIETIAVCVNPKAKPSNTTVISTIENERRIVKQNYICDRRFPYWIIYRDEAFDNVCQKLKFDIFNVFRDRQLTNALMTENSCDIRVIKSRNIDDSGSKIISISGYDSYVPQETAKTLSVYRFFNDDTVYLTPNMTYNPRVIRKPKDVLVNGSAAILLLKEGEPPLEKNELLFFSSTEYREFYRTARNRQTRSLNIDSSSVFFFGRLIERKEENV
ncbi:MAG: DNA cytosine methyltransferase [Helicobacteraceae bacterium]|jgi:DNA (cytosine-5)-methyltransferase 1|nr:DNA cytosine methyltransferase [Helicobacteraceae bacterium]